MEEIEHVDPDYQKGFNEGYIMKKHLPDLADKLAEVASDSQRSTGFKEGRNQLILEREKERYPDWLRSDRLSNLDNSPDKGKEKDDFERSE